MKIKHLTPSSRFLKKMYLSIGIGFLAVLAGGLFLALIIGSEEGFGAGMTAIAVIFFLNLVWAVPAFLLVKPYYNSLKYEVADDEVIVRAGIMTKTVKHVPYRTVTNITVKRGLLDRLLFNIGTLNIQRK